MRYAVSVVFLAFVLAACEHANPLDSGGLPPTLETIQTSIFDTNCALPGCHAGTNPQMGLNLSAGEARGNLVGVASAEVPGLLRVDPGNPDDSYIIIKLEGGARMAPGTSRMPFGRAPLPDEQIDLVREWIEGGAE